MNLRDAIYDRLMQTLPPDVIRRLPPERREALVQDLILLFDDITKKGPAVEQGDPLNTLFLMGQSAALSDNIHLEASNQLVICQGAIAGAVASYKDDKQLPDEEVDDVAFAIFGLIFNTIIIAAAWNIDVPAVLTACANFMITKGEIPGPSLRVIQGGKEDDGEEEEREEEESRDEDEEPGEETEEPGCRPDGERQTGRVPTYRSPRDKARGAPPRRPE